MKQVFNAEKSNLNGWHNNTHLSVNLKTQLRSDRKMRTSKEYQGILRRDVEVDEFHYDEHFTFVETLPWMSKRNPRVYNGKYINITRRDDGTLRPNFKPLTINEDFSVERYAFGVYRELHQALEGLVEKGDVRCKMYDVRCKSNRQSQISVSVRKKGTIHVEPCFNNLCNLLIIKYIDIIIYIRMRYGVPFKNN